MRRAISLRYFRNRVPLYAAPAIPLALLLRRTTTTSNSLGLPRLSCPSRLNPIEPPRYATRMPGGVGRGQLPIRCPPDENYHHQVTATTEPAPQ